MMHGSCNIRLNRLFFVTLGHFLHSDPLNNLKNQNFTSLTTLKIKIWKKYKKTPGDIFLLPICTIN